MADRVSSNCLKLASILKEYCCVKDRILSYVAIVTILLIWRRCSHVKKNRINFWTLLSFRVNAGDIVIGEHLATAARNAMYTSSVIQNHLVDIRADQIRHKILDKMKRAI